MNNKILALLFLVSTYAAFGCGACSIGDMRCDCPQVITGCALAVAGAATGVATQAACPIICGCLSGGVCLCDGLRRDELNEDSSCFECSYELPWTMGFYRAGVTSAGYAPIHQMMDDSEISPLMPHPGSPKGPTYYVTEE